MQFTFNLPNVLEQIDIDKKGYQTVVLRSLNKVARSAEVRANRQIREVYNLHRADVDKGITVRPASATELKAVISVKGKRLPLVLFNARQLQAGVKVTITKGGRTLLPHVFIAQMKSGHLGVFGRVGNARLPIKERYTISVAEMFGSRVVIQDLETYISEQLPAVLTHELDYYLSQN